jgi:Zn-dependent peptidase ImmA (M78 family)
MSERINANIKPELLIWARTSFGLTPEVAAKKIGVKLHILQSWESADSSPTINQLRKAASVYKRPLAVFFLHEIPKSFDAMKDFRRIADTDEVKLSPDLMLEIRRVQYKREIALELSEEMDEDNSLIEFNASLNDDAENLSSKIRSLLDIKIEDQIKWTDQYTAYNAWRDSVEKLNVLVFQTSHMSRIDISEMRGFSISEKKLPAIVLNSSDKPNGKIFTLLHELTHLFLNNGGICDLEDYFVPKTENQSVEVFCNYVSGAILVPKDILLKDERVLQKGSDKTWSDLEISALSSTFSVSREVILRRLLIFGKTSESFYRSKRDEFLELYREISKSKDKGFAPYHRLVIRNNGSSYLRMILNAYYQEIITSSQLSDFIGAKLSHLPKIESALL